MTEDAGLDMGAAYTGYLRRRVWRLTEALMEEWVVLAEEPERQQTRRDMLASIESWWRLDDEAQRSNLEHDFLDRFDFCEKIGFAAIKMRACLQTDPAAQSA